MGPRLLVQKQTFTTVGFNTETTSDWENEQGTVPLNWFVQQLFKIGPQPMAFPLGMRYYAEKPAGGPDWRLRFVMALLCPQEGGCGPPAQRRPQPLRHSYGCSCCCTPCASGSRTYGRGVLIMTGIRGRWPLIDADLVLRPQQGEQGPETETARSASFNYGVQVTAYGVCCAPASRRT